MTPETNPQATAETVEASALLQRATQLIGDGYRLALVAAHHDVSDRDVSDRDVSDRDVSEPPTGPDAIRVVYLFAAGSPDRRVELHLTRPISDPTVPSLASISFPAGRFEREAQDLFGVRLVGHHQPARLVLHQHWPAGWSPMRRDAGIPPRFDEESTSYPFLAVDGPGVYEIPVGPVHAGVIEPGHFRFSVVGETIVNMKARLWFVHKGIERLFQGRTIDAGVELAERTSGDTAVGHNLAYCLAVEQAASCVVPDGAHVLRAALLEFERMYNHVTDLGAMCNDVAFSIVNAHTMRLRERLLRINERITGHRLLRGAITPGGARVGWLPAIDELTAIRDEVADIVGVVMANATAVDRFKGTAVLTHDDARQIGVLGYVARASGIDADARRDHPFAPLYDRLAVPVITGGDVMSRFLVRVAEIDASTALLGELLPLATVGNHVARLDPRDGPRSGTALVEGWRGTIAHRLETRADGTLSRVKIVDPSFFNWPALPVALASDTIVPDFPLANKSFNLSYAGNDL